MNWLAAAAAACMLGVCFFSIDTHLQLFLLAYLARPEIIIALFQYRVVSGQIRSQEVVELSLVPNRQPALDLDLNFIFTFAFTVFHHQGLHASLTSGQSIIIRVKS